MERRSGLTPLRGRPLDDNGRIEFSVQMRDRDRLCLELLSSDRRDAIGASVAFLLHAADVDRDLLRTILQSQCEKENSQRGSRIIDVLAQIAR